MDEPLCIQTSLAALANGIENDQAHKAMETMLFGQLLTAYVIPQGGAQRSIAEWNVRFEQWCRPASNSEEEKIQRTARMVKQAIDSYGGVLTNCAVIPKGSYQSNTNVRANSDMDIAVVHPNVITISDWGVELPNSALGLIWLDRTNAEVFREFKAHLTAAMAEKFGLHGVTSGNKAIAIHANPGTRVDADVVPALTLWNILPKQKWENLFIPSYHEGIALLPPSGERIINYPIQAHINGVSKNNSTGRRYKRVVRILKQMKEELNLRAMPSLLSAHYTPPSYLIESLCYNVRDDVYNNSVDYYELVSETLKAITGGIEAGNYFVETNNIKPLFASTGRYKQPWSSAIAHHFCTSALKWMGN